MNVWILTDEYLLYDQQGEYFVEVFADKPTVEKLKAVTGYNEEACQQLIETGRVGDMHNHWYNLCEVVCK